MESSTDLVTRDGPTVIDYLIDFFNYLKRTTGFRADHFRAPTELQETLEKMEFYKIPRELWNAILNAALKIIAEFPRMENIDELVSFIVIIIIEFVQYLLKNFFLRCTLRLLSQVASPIISTIIICIYHFVTWVMIPLMNYIKPKVEEYIKFTINQFREFFKPRSRELLPAFRFNY